MPLFEPADDGPPVATVPLVAAWGERMATERMADILAREGLDVVARVERPAELEALAQSVHPHVMLMIEGDAHDVVADIRSVWRQLPQTRIIYLPRDERPAAVRGALKAGADGVLPQPRAAAALGAAVRSVSLGLAIVPLSDRAALARHPLTDRERQVLEMAADGMSNLEIGQRLHLAESTIKSHVSSGFSKLGVRSRDELPALIRDGRVDYRAGHARQSSDGGGKA